MALLGVKPLPFEADPSLWVLFHDPQVTPPRISSWLRILTLLHTACALR